MSELRLGPSVGWQGGSPYQLRHTFATAALAAGISIFELARMMGASVKIINKHYGRLARDSEQTRSRLDARAEQARPTGD
jgi:integrase